MPKSLDRFRWFPPQLRLGVVLLATVACANGEGSDANDLVIERLTVGDTTVVRTVSGSQWANGAVLTPTTSIGVLDGPDPYMFGNVLAIASDSAGRVLVLDGQARTIRVYNPEGEHVTDIGREGSGPGEFRNPDRGMAVLPDGRIVVRDPGNGRLQVFTDNGQPEAQWSVVSAQWRSREPLFRHADTLLTLQPDGLVRDISNVTTALVRIAPDGNIVDTLAVPVIGTRIPQLVARVGGNTAAIDVPWAPAPVWAWHQDGFFVVGNGATYALTLLRKEGLLRIERAVASQPVGRGERAQEEARVTAGLRWLDPAWRWDGAAIPDTKPFFHRVYIASDGRLWLLRPGAAEPIANPERDANDVEIAWSETLEFDVFEGDGTFLGTIPVPAGFKADRTPIIDHEGMWVVVDAPTGEQRVVRYALRVSP